MRGSMKLVSMLLVLCLMLGALPLAMAEGQLARGYGGGGGKGAL